MKTAFSQGIIDLWHESEAQFLTPDMDVITVRWYTDQWKESGLLYDHAYINTPCARRNCWWLSKPDIVKNCKTESMSLGDYIKLHLRECSGMNPFWSLGRTEFLLKFKTLNPDFTL